jgi:prepilin-type processing-associated H-X9-DG protein
VFADKDPAGRLATGQNDHTRDGCMDSYGWAADLVNIGVGKPSEMMCPSNPLLGSEKINDITGNLKGVATPAEPAAIEGNTSTRLLAGNCGKSDFRGYSGSGMTGTYGNSALTGERPYWVAWAIVAEGYNTNYSCSWFLSRSAPKTTSTASVLHATSTDTADQTKGGLKGQWSTVGPLTRRVAENANAPTSSIALIGDAAPGDVTESTQVQEIRQGGAGDYLATALGVDTDRLWIPSGALTTEAANDGPAYWNSTKISLLQKNNGFPLDKQMKCDIDKNCGQPLGPGVNDQYMQDTRDWFTVHGSGKGAGANILMADGSVKTFYDLNGDGFLNPGFPVTGVSAAAGNQDTVGFTDNKVELPAGEMFNGVFLQKITKGKLEE